MSSDVKALLAFLPFAITGTVLMLSWRPLLPVVGFGWMLSISIILGAVACVWTALLLSVATDTEEEVG